MREGERMYDQMDLPVLVIQEDNQGRNQVNKFSTPEDGLAFYDFLKNHTDLCGITDLRLCVTVLQHTPERKEK